ncbi:MAG: DNA mismatch repair endonuclease MutL, partial [Anaerovoracaceae bacterium]
MIKVLEKHIADKIAAGEVIDRPVSIVKELVENAVDAGASSIVVEIRNGGKSYIRVTDDGCGIPEDQVETAFLRHATSKIHTAGDLDAIGTLGFRGEALASICAVSRTEMVTKCHNSKTGTRVLLHGGEVMVHQQTGCPDGTTMIVTDLFYNTPARLKFLKSDSAESGMIIDFMSQMALAYKAIKFRFINNGTVLFSTAGDGNRFNTIVRVYKNVDPKNLIPVSYTEGKLRLEGYISTPAQTKNSRSSQVFFVNGRVVHSKVMEKGLAEGYRERIFDGRHPVAYLFLETDPADLDVNIHPNKREVRFDHEADIIDFMTRAIRITLGSEAAMVSGASLFREKMEEYGIQKEKEEQVDIKTFLSNIPFDNTSHPVIKQKAEPAPDMSKNDMSRIEKTQT